MTAVSLPVASDPTLLTDVRRYGKFDIAGCFQCGSCTISCDLMTDYKSSPRQSIRQVLLGLRAPLEESLGPWICHDCGDCSDVCPRQADPRSSMMTLRQYLAAKYDWTGVAPKILRSTAWHAGALGFMAVLTLLLIVLYHVLYVHLTVSHLVTNPAGLEHMFPTITYFVLTVTLLPLFLLVSRTFRIWRLTMGGKGRPHVPISVYAGEAWTYIYQSITHSLVLRCSGKQLWFGHWLLALGTTMMLVIKTFSLKWFQTDNIYPLYHPQRWLGYLATAFIVYGIGGILIRRLQNHQDTAFQDMAFPVLLLLTALSGISVHILRLAGFERGLLFAYAIHLMVVVPMLVIEMSFGKWSHMIYRPLALYFHAVREKAWQQAPAEEALGHAI